VFTFIENPIPVLGSIVLRIGEMLAKKEFYYDYHIGYQINEEYRGRGGGRFPNRNGSVLLSFFTNIMLIS
jgi:hypothetical protein